MRLISQPTMFLKRPRNSWCSLDLRRGMRGSVMRGAALCVRQRYAGVPWAARGGARSRAQLLEDVEALQPEGGIRHTSKRSLSRHVAILLEGLQRRRELSLHVTWDRDGAAVVGPWLWLWGQGCRMDCGAVGLWGCGAVGLRGCGAVGAEGLLCGFYCQRLLLDFARTRFPFSRALCNRCCSCASLPTMSTLLLLMAATTSGFCRSSNLPLRRGWCG